jgi:RNA polymerase-binding transcription factor DksA
MSHLSRQDLDDLRRALEHERSALRSALAAHQREGRGVATEENDDADTAGRIIDQDDALRLAGFDRALLTDVEHALAKLDAGTYGTSEDSGVPISLERLRAMPWARRTREEEEARRRG